MTALHWGLMAGLAMTAAVAADPPVRPLVGAIRWDCW